MIAIVEDDEAVLHSLEFSLETQGYRVRAFKDAGAALASGAITDADCVVVDYGLPELDGAALLGILRSRGVACPAIIVASTPGRHCRSEAARLGVPLLEKPVMGDTLLALIGTLIGAG